MNAVSNEFDNPKLTLQRRKVYTALKPLLGVKKLLHIMWLWEEEISTQQPMQMRKFIAMLVEQELLGKNAQKAYKNLVYTFMQKNEERLEDDPYEAMLQFKNVQQIKSESAEQDEPAIHKSADNVVFETVLREFLTSVRALNHKSTESIARHLYKQTTDLKVTKTQRRNLTAWIIEHNGDLHMVCYPDQMRAILSATYVVACDCIGPIKTDKCLSLAVKKSEDIPEALVFSPRQLL